MVKKIAFVFIIILALCSPVLAEEKKEGFKDFDKTLAKIPGDTITSTINVFHQGILFRYPKEWGVNPVHKNQKGGHFIIEFIPKEQALNTWKDMFTIQGFNGLATAKDISAEKMAMGLKQHMSSLAPSSSYFKEVYKGDVNGYSGTIVLMGIKQMPVAANPPLGKGAGEIGLYLFLKGEKDMYILHRSWKTDMPYTDEKLPMTDAELNRWISYLKQVKLIQSMMKN